MNELVSIIIPVYKVEKYIRQCIESVLSQEYTNIEVILVDDGSPDNCGLICDNYAKQDSRVKVIHKNNEGISAARNSGLDIASGKFIAFVDSDDYVSTQYISTMIKEFDNNNIDLVICSFFNVICHENNQETLELPLTNTDTKTIISGTDIIVNRFTDSRIKYTVPWNKLYKAEIFTKIRFKKGVLHEDEFIYRSIMECCNQITVIDTPLYYYRKRADSIMSNYSSKNFEYQLIWMSKEIEYYRNNNYFDALLTLEHLLCHEYALYKKNLNMTIKRMHYLTISTAMKDITLSSKFPLITRCHYLIEYIILYFSLLNR